MADKEKKNEELKNQESVQNEKNQNENNISENEKTEKDMELLPQDLNKTQIVLATILTLIII